VLQRLLVAVVLGGFVSLHITACGSNPSSPSSSSIAGTWTGSINDSLVGPGSVRITFNQSGGPTLSGTWSASFANGALTNGGSFTGSMTGSNISAILTPNDPLECPYNLTATRTGNTMTGTYAAFNCTVAVSGSVTVTKE
jgi:hypothetical protein